ncbi:trypsin-like serine protease [Candidatus Fermentibacteria bacterium]|nr:trypsin-like serine protease [Candidatus Fermentibacteria bacterium]
MDNTLHGLSPEYLPMASLTVYTTLVEDDPVFDDDFSCQGSAACIGRNSGYIELVTNMHCTGLMDLAENGDLGFLGDGELEVKVFDMEVAFPTGRTAVVESFQLFFPYDLAVLRVEEEGLKECHDFVILDMLPNGVNSPPPGSPVLAVGSPLGLEGSVTSGIVSAYRDFESFFDGPGYGPYIQIDAAVSPGNSGGPLLCLHEGGYFLIGLNSWTLTNGSWFSGRTGQNLNFALDLRETLLRINENPAVYSANIRGVIEAMDEVFDVDAVEAGR